MPRVDEIRSASEMSPTNAAADDAPGDATEMPVNEIVKSAQQAKQGEESAKPEGDNRAAWIAAGVGVGIGSAALVAALLYANRDKGKDRKKS